MGYSQKSFVIVLTYYIILVMSLTKARPIANELNTAIPLVTRLVQMDNGGESSRCWDSLYELHSCLGEVILFFLNGETQLGQECCGAIHTIEHQCRSEMLNVIGFTSQESDILRGYCDEEEAASTNHSVPPPVAVAVLNTSTFN